MAVITISRETGSEGWTIAQAVAKRLGVPSADREVIEEAARLAGLPEEILHAKEQETGQQRTFSSSDMVGLVRRSQAGRRKRLEDEVYAKFVADAIHGLAEKPCVIIGRGSQFVLGDRSDALHVHIYAPEAVRIARVMRDQGVPRQEAARIVRSSDATRANYIKQYHNNANWRSPDRYNLMIDTGRIPPDVAVEIIARAAEAIG